MKTIGFLLRFWWMWRRIPNYARLDIEGAIINALWIGGEPLDQSVQLAVSDMKQYTRHAEIFLKNASTSRLEHCFKAGELKQEQVKQDA